MNAAMSEDVAAFTRHDAVLFLLVAAFKGRVAVKSRSFQSLGVALQAWKGGIAAFPVLFAAFPFRLATPRTAEPPPAGRAPRSAGGI